MGVAKFFDGSVLHYVDTDDSPLPSVLKSRTGALDQIDDENTRDPNAPQYRVEPDAGPDLSDPAVIRELALRGTGANVVRDVSLMRETPPGDGLGAGVGAPSGQPIPDPWNNNPSRVRGGISPQNAYAAGIITPEAYTALTGEPPPAAKAETGGLKTFEEMTKGELGAHIAEAGGVPPASNAPKAEFVAAAKSIPLASPPPADDPKPEG